MTEQYPRDRCYFCSSTDEIESHHVLPKRFGGPDTDDNLVDVCRQCHQKLENLYDAQFWSKIEISKATHEPEYVDLDSNDVYRWQPTLWPNDKPDDVSPGLCPGCERMGPFHRNSHQPSGKLMFTCHRCDQIILVEGYSTHEIGNVIDIIEILEDSSAAAYEPDVVSKAAEYTSLSREEAEERIEELLELNRVSSPRDKRLRSTTESNDD